MLVWKCVLRVRKRPIADDFPTTVVRLRTANDLKVRSYLVLVDKWVRRRRALLSRLRYVGRCRVAKSPGIDLVPAERVRCIFSVNSVKSATRTASKGGAIGANGSSPQASSAVSSFSQIRSNTPQNTGPP